MESIHAMAVQSPQGGLQGGLQGAPPQAYPTMGVQDAMGLQSAMAVQSPQGGLQSGLQNGLQGGPQQALQLPPHDPAARAHTVQGLQELQDHKSKLHKYKTQLQKLQTLQGSLQV